MLIRRYNYKPIERVESEEYGRSYLVEDTKLPSVTTILSTTKSEEFTKSLSDWRNAVGPEEAARITEQSANIGDILHKNLEDYITSGKKPEGPFLAKMMTDTVINKGLVNFNEVWALEAALYYEGLYAGTADLVGVHKGYPVIGDFKNSRNNKSYDMIEDYRCQIAAYSMAHNKMFGTNIKKGVIMMVTQQCNYLEFIIEGKKYEDSVALWLQKLDQYYTKISK